MKPIKGPGAPVITATPKTEATAPKPTETPSPEAVPHSSFGQQAKKFVHDLMHHEHHAPVRSPQFEQVAATLARVAGGEKLTSPELQALATPLASLEPADVRRLMEKLDAHLMPWNAAGPAALLERVAQASGLPASEAQAAAEVVKANTHHFRRVDGPVQVTLDRVLAGGKLTADEFGKWLDGFLKLGGNDRRNIALQLFDHLGLHPAKQEEIAKELAKRAGLPESLADSVPHYQAGQDLTVVASLAYRFGLPLVNVGVSAGLGVMVPEKNLETGKHTPVVLAPQGFSAGVVSVRTIESIEEGHFKMRVGAIATSPLAVGIGAGQDPIFGPIIAAKLSPLASVFVGEGSVGGRLPLSLGFVTGSGWALSAAVREPRLQGVTDGVIRQAHVLGVEAHELTEYVKRAFVGVKNAIVTGLEASGENAAGSL